MTIINTITIITTITMIAIITGLTAILKPVYTGLVIISFRSQLVSVISLRLLIYSVLLPFFSRSVVVDGSCSLLSSLKFKSKLMKCNLPPQHLKKIE
jgi:hypothetical protein